MDLSYDRLRDSDGSGIHKEAIKFRVFILKQLFCILTKGHKGLTVD
jgi:hypothetical protein